MFRTVHGPLLAVIVTVLCSGICGLQINQEDAVAVTDKFSYNNLEADSLVEPSIPIENHVKFIPEDDVDTIVTAVEGNQSENAGSQKDATFGEADVVAKHRMVRQANHQYSPLYPQLPSGPPYNPYQPQPNNNPAGQNPYQQQPGYNPYGQNANQQQPSYNPYGQNANQQQPSYNPYGQNANQQQPSYNPYTQNPNQQQPSYNPYTPNPNQQQPTFKPAGQNQFSHWSSNSSQPGYNPSSGQNPYNSRPNLPSNNSTSPGNSYRPPNAAGSSFTTPYPSYNPRPGQPPYNNYPPSSGSSYPVQPFNSTSQQPFFNPTYNSSRPNPTPGSSSTNSQYPNYRPSQGTYNVTLPKTPQGSPYFPGPNGQFPSNSYNPSIPNYPPQNQAQNNFYYPQNNNTAAYDPRKVPSQNFSYH